MIKLYGFDACTPCKQVKRLLDKFGIEYEYIDVFKNPTSGYYSFPVLVLDDGREFKGLSQDLVKHLRELGKQHRKKKQ